jgi:hypothetical protein
MTGKVTSSRRRTTARVVPAPQSDQTSFPGAPKVHLAGPRFRAELNQYDLNRCR